MCSLIWFLTWANPYRSCQRTISAVIDSLDSIEWEQIHSGSHTAQPRAPSPPLPVKPPPSCAGLEMMRDGARPATWPLCPPSPPPPPAPHHIRIHLFLVNSGFKRNAASALLFCTTSIKSRHRLSLSGPAVRQGEPPTARYTRTPLKPSPAPASSPWAFLTPDSPPVRGLIAIRAD